MKPKQSIHSELSTLLKIKIDYYDFSYISYEEEVKLEHASLVTKTQEKLKKKTRRKLKKKNFPLNHIYGKIDVKNSDH